MLSVKKFAIVAGVVAAAAGTAHAADLPARVAPAPYIAPLPIFTWTGAYFGINAGAAFDNKQDSPPRPIGRMASAAPASATTASPAVDRSVTTTSSTASVAAWAAREAAS